VSGPGIAWTTVEDALHDWITYATGLANDHVIWSGQNADRPSTPFVEMTLGVVQRVGLDGVQFVDAPLVLAPLVATPTVATSTFLSVAHGRNTGDGPVRPTADGYGLLADTNYWFIVIDADHFQLATSFQLAMALTALALSAGSGNVTFASTADTVAAGAEMTAKSFGMRRVRVTFQAFATDAFGNNAAGPLLDSVVTALPRRASTLRAAGVCVLDCNAVTTSGGVIDSSIFEPRAVLEIVLSLASEVDEPTTRIERALVTPTVDGVVKPTTTVA
jgi:hypothetical protein